MKEVHDEALDVTSILILISHDHNLAISQCLGISIVLVVLKPNDLLQRRDLCIVLHLQPTAHLEAVTTLHSPCVQEHTQGSLSGDVCRIATWYTKNKQVSRTIVQAQYPRPRDDGQKATTFISDM